MNIREKYNQMNEKQVLSKYQKTVEEINQMEDFYKNCSDEQLQQKTLEFKQRLEKGETVRKLAVEAFAVVREAADRVLGMRHFDVQLAGGLVLLDGNISEMATGEGKTLVASLPSYLKALEGKGVHVITVNEYLAQRDKELIGQIHEFLGLTVGLNIPGLSVSEKQQAYQCDITYGVGTEFGFDYLRDNTVSSLDQKAQRPYHFAIIDEIDSVLIDEAKTPLIIAGKDNPSDRLYRVCSSVIKSMKEEDDYTYDIELKVVNFTEQGLNKAEKVFGVDNLFELEHGSLFHSLLQALRARVLYKRDVDYIVDQGQIKLVDMNTGRIMDGRSLSDGLHQAIEAKEGLVTTKENKTHATITIQNYYRMYKSLSGMTGTAKTEETELKKIYGMNVIKIPTNRPNQRKDHSDIAFLTKEQKYAFLLKEVKQRHEKGQPILIGTTSILQSEDVARVLDKEQLPYQLLNAKSVTQEANLIAQAGQKNKITIATNMAGRGTDIMLGDGASELGGLYVIGTERNESRRIDDQLKGRSARQGDPGETQFIISLEDYLFVRYAAEELERALPKFKTDDAGRIIGGQIHKFIETAQKICEGVHYQLRDYNLNLENVLNDQRSIVYSFRDKLLETDNPLEYVEKQIQKLPEKMIDVCCNAELLPDEWNLESLEEELNKVLLVSVPLTGRQFETARELKQFVQPAVEEHFQQLKTWTDNEKVQQSTRGTALYIVDNLWKRHLESMNQLKEGIGLRQYQQESPIELFQKEGYILFESMYDEIRYELAVRINDLIKQTREKEEASA